MTARQPKGIPAGGQFAASAHDEASSSLSPSQPEPLRVSGFISESQAEDILWSLDKYTETGDDAMYERARANLGEDDDDVFQAILEHHQDESPVPYAERGYDNRREITGDFRDIYGAWRSHDEDVYRAPAHFGARAHEAEGKSVTEVNKMLRDEFSRATASGYLPQGIGIRVFKHHTEPRVEVTGLAKEQRIRPYREGEDYTNTTERMRELPEFVELRNRITSVAHTFATDKTDRQSHDPVYLTKNMPIVTFS